MGVPADIDNSIHSAELNARDIPRLAGSAAGFIILVAALCLIILVALAGIYVLLRENVATDEELQRGSRRPRTTAYKTPLVNRRSFSSSWLSRTYHRLSFVHTPSSGSIPRIKVEHIEEPFSPLRSESVDDLSPDLPPMDRPPQADKLRTSISTPGNTHGLPSPNSNPAGSVRFDLNHIRQTPPTDGEGQTPYPANTPQNIHTSLPSSSPPIPPLQSPISHQEGLMSNLSLSGSSQHGHGVNQRATLEIPVLTTFGGGTKFIEAL